MVQHSPSSGLLGIRGANGSDMAAIAGIRMTSAWWNMGIIENNGRFSSGAATELTALFACSTKTFSCLCGTRVNKNWPSINGNLLQQFVS